MTPQMVLTVVAGLLVVGAVVTYAWWSWLRSDRRQAAESDAILTRLTTRPAVAYEWPHLAQVVHDAAAGVDPAVGPQLSEVEAAIKRLANQAEGDDRRFRLLREYASQGLAQSRVSFRVSLSAAGLGFVTILVGVALAVAELGWQIALVPVAAGGVIEAVAALFFIHDRRAQRTMLEFLDQLRQDRKLDDGLRLISEITNPTLRDRLHAQLSLHLVGVGEPALVFRQTAGDARPADLAELLLPTAPVSPGAPGGEPIVLTGGAPGVVTGGGSGGPGPSPGDRPARAARSPRPNRWPPAASRPANRPGA